MRQFAFKKKHLSIQTYGYNYTRNDLLLTLAVYVSMVVCICYLHRLQFLYTMIVLATMCFMLPIFLSSYFFYKHEKLRFEEYCKYFEYMKIYFKTYKKIKTALENIITLFPEKSHMYSCIKEAIDEIALTGNYEKALTMIEKDYYNSYLARFHNLLITGEMHGSDSVYENLDLINYEHWKEDIKMHQNRKKTFRYMLYGMTIFSVGLSYYGVNMFADSLMNLFDNSDYQLYTFLNIEGILGLFMCVYISFVNKKWIRSDD